MPLIEKGTGFTGFVVLRLPSLKKLRINLGRLVNFHFHFEGVQLLLDLLSEHWRQAIARRNLTAPVILSTWPRVVKDNPWAESSISLAGATLGRGWSTLRVLT